jgi:hypothetical protein
MVVLFGFGIVRTFRVGRPEGLHYVERGNAVAVTTYNAETAELAAAMGLCGFSGFCVDCGDLPFRCRADLQGRQA